MTAATKTNKVIVKTLQGQYAGFATRFLAFIIDALVVFFIVLAIAFGSSLLLSFFSVDEIILDWLSDLVDNSAIGGVFRWLAALGMVTITSFLYHVIFWTMTGGKSIGKALVGVRIVRLDGRPLTFLRNIRRYITFWLAAIPLFFGLLWVLVDDRRQGWHDKLSATCVIYDWPALENQGTIESLQTRWAYVKATRTRVKLRAKKEADKIEKAGKKVKKTSRPSE